METDNVAIVNIPLGQGTPTPFALRTYLPGTIKAVCISALDGDQAAIEMVFQQATLMALYCAILASDFKRQEKLKPIIEKLPAVPVLDAVNKSLGLYTKAAYSQFEIGKSGSTMFRGEWDYTNPASRTMIQIIILMTIFRDAAASKKMQGEPLNEMESACDSLPTTQGSEKERKVACVKWRDSFLKFCAKAHAAGWLKNELINLPEFASYRNRRENPMTGIKERVLNFFQKHLSV